MKLVMSSAVVSQISLRLVETDILILNYTISHFRLKFIRHLLGKAELATMIVSTMIFLIILVYVLFFLIHSWLDYAVKWPQKK